MIEGIAERVGERDTGRPTGLLAKTSGVESDAGRVAAADTRGVELGTDRDPGERYQRVEDLSDRHGAPGPDVERAAFVEAEAGVAEPVVKHGRLDAERDFLDVRDMARAYAAALDVDEGGTFNVGTGRAVAIAEILHTLIGLARIPVRAELDPSRVRGGEPTRIALDAALFRQKTGWSPRIALADSLRDTLDFWRSSIRHEEGARA